MAKRVIAKADIDKASAEGLKILHVAATDMVTPLARDTALELGVKIVCGESASAATLFSTNGGNQMASEQQVEEIVKAVLAKLATPAPAPFTDLPGRACPTPRVYGTRPGSLKLVEIAKGHEMPNFELRNKDGVLENKPEIDFRLEDFVTVKDGSSVGAGFMSWQKGGFNWTLTYDEVDYVVEGIMEITYEGRTIRANKGDLVFIPAGSAIHWHTPSWVLVYYVTFPAEWAAQ